MSYKYRENPTDLSCFKACAACMRCENKGMKDACFSCSGRFDPEVKKDPYYIDDRCRCKEGILQVRLSNGKLVKSKYPTDPFSGNVRIVDKTADEKDYESYVEEQKNRYGEDFDPVKIREEETPGGRYPGR